MRDVLLRLSVLLTMAASCSGSGSGARAPVEHRVTSAVCPQQRGAGVSIDPSGCAQNPGADLSCTKDGDCTAGANGRCLEDLGPACRYSCSYDACSSDSDCTAGTPCACRSSSSGTGANTCATESNCRTDADCGSGGFCSPSLVGSPCGCSGEIFCQADSGSSCSETGADGVTKPVPCSCSGNCGHGYFCHTRKDSCLNDEDCANGTSCNFDLTSQKWMCTGLFCPS